MKKVKKGDNAKVVLRRESPISLRLLTGSCNMLNHISVIYSDSSNTPLHNVTVNNAMMNNAMLNNAMLNSSMQNSAMLKNSILTNTTLQSIPRIGQSSITCRSDRPKSVSMRESREKNSVKKYSM